MSKGDVLACRFNGNLHYVGRAAIVGHVDGQVLYPDKLIRLRASQIEHRFLCHVINSPPSRRQIESKAATTAGNIGINGGQLRSIVIPLPPLAEQHRIVARVDELMSLLDRLEAHLLSATETQAAFAAAAVHQLDASDPADAEERAA